MNYKETLFFIGKCLTITHEEKNKISIEKTLKSGNIDWDIVVKTSTGHFVFLALYCNLKNANFLHFLPNDLLEYMKHITDLNRERNQQIIQQAKEVNTLLLAHNITPIFLKGTGNLLDGLYEDIAERMVGDIDFLVGKSDLEKTISILKKDTYKPFDNSGFLDTNHRHSPRLIKENKIAALEVHHELLNEKGAVYFNYDFVKNGVVSKKNITVLNNDNQLLLTIFSKQINDNGHVLKSIALRSFYDTFLISNKTDTLKAIQTLDSLLLISNCYLAMVGNFLNDPKTIRYSNTKESKKFVADSLKMLKRPNKRKIVTYYVKFKKALKTIITSSQRKEYVLHLLKQAFKKPTS